MDIQRVYYLVLLLGYSAVFVACQELEERIQSINRRTRVINAKLSKVLDFVSRIVCHMMKRE